MKYLSKLLSMLLVGAMLYSTGCTDWGKDIENLENKVDEIQKELQEGQINPLKADLAQTKEDLAKAQEAINALTTKHNEDIEALKAVDSQLDGKIKAANDAILALEGTLEQEVAALEAEIDTLETAIAQAKQEAKDADAALKAELLKEITDLETELLAKITELQTKLEGDIETLRTDMQTKIDEANKAIDEANDAIDALDLRVDALEQTDETLQAEIDALEDEIAKTNAELAVLKADLAAEKAAREAADAEEKAAREAAVKALQEAIEALEAKHDAEVALLQDAIAALESKVDAELNLLKHRDAEFEQLLAAAQAGIESLGKQVEANYNELKGDVAALKSELQAEIEANKTAIAQNRFDIDRALAAVETLNGNVAALQASLQSTNQTLFTLMSDYYSFKSEIVGRVASLEANVANLEAMCSQIAEELIPALENQIAQNAALIEQTVADVKANAAALEAYKKAAAETFSLLEQADAALWSAVAAVNQTVYENKAEIANLRYELVESLTGVREEIAASFAEIYARFDEMNRTMYSQFGELWSYIDAVYGLTVINADAINAEVAARQAADTAISDELKAFQLAYNAKVAELHKLIDTLEADLAALNAAFEEYKNEVEQKIADAIATAVKNANEYTDAAIVTLTSYVDTQDTKLSNKLDEAVAALDKAYKDADDILKAQIINGDKILQEQINEIVNRAQSLVFVPKYTDGKGTINYAKAGETVVESRSQAEYQVYPAECANAIVSAFNPEKPNLTFDYENLQTRSGLSFKVVAVKEGSKPGRILVTFEPRGLDAEFYAGNPGKEYALSLHLNTEKVNLSSPYTNFVRAKKFDDITMAIYDGDEVVSSTDKPHMTHKFDYNNIEATVEILPNHILKYAIGDKLYTEQELNDAGYALSSKRIDIAERVVDYQNEGGIDPFKYELVNDIINVSVNVVDNSLIGRVIKFGYKYVAGGLETVAFDYAVTTPVIAKIGFAGQATTWNYTDDAAVDAAFFANENQTEKVYSRSFPLNLANDVLSETLPKDAEGKYDLTVLDVLKYQGTVVKEPVVKVYNVAASKYEVVENVDAEFVVDADDNVKFNFSGFEWNKKYEVVVTYSLHRVAGEPFLTVDVTTFVETTGRPQDTITINLAEEQWMLTKNFLYESKTAPETLSAVSDRYEGFLGKETPESFLKAIFVDNEFTSENLVNDNEEELEYTKLVIVNDGAEVESVYNITDFAVIPEAVEYVYTITTWYGQEIVITKKLNIGLTPVEITLSTETKDLVKDLTFTTAAESLAPIFENVTRVDKDQFTAAEYLKAIFADSDRALRAQEDLANGETLLNTKLVVYAPNAAAKYDYNDFAATPESVVYKSTYTTWYGQVITINKVVNINVEGLYNYVHIPEWVYNVDGTGFYSNAIPKYLPGDVAYLNGILVKLDMNSAFRVFNKQGVDVTDELSSLGLTNKFMFVQAPVDTRIEFKENNMLYYHGHDKKVYVKAQLTLENSNGVKTVLPSNFDEGEKYDGYYVNQYNPVGILKSEALSIPVANIAKTYSYNVLNQLKLTDNRGFNLIKRGEGTENDNEVVWTPAEWVVGDTTNGFGSGISVADVYGLKIVSLTCSEIPSYLVGKLEFNATTGELYFNNLNNIQLAQPVVLKVKAVVEHDWATQTTEFEVTLYNVK